MNTEETKPEKKEEMHGHFQTVLWGTLLLLLVIAVMELWKPRWPSSMMEGFADMLVPISDSPFWIKWMPRRGDVGPDPHHEQGGYMRDIRYFAGYTDVQRIGHDHDFCRMIHPTSDPKDMFFACALAATEGLSTVKYRTPSTKDGAFEVSRDDYMADVRGEGRKGYCRVLKTGAETFEPMCNFATDTGFSAKTVIDPNPPAPIRTLLGFYEGVVFWLRFRDDMVDYAKNLITTTAGQLQENMDESEPNPPVTRGLRFNGSDQYMRIGDASDLSFGDVVQLRYLRAVSFWVYFDEFTNNAHVFDFGNGAGKDNVFCGIIGRGDAPTSAATDTAADSACQLNTVPTAPSGAQCTEEVSPQVAMATSRANINTWSCPAPELTGRIMPPLQPLAVPAQDAHTATLLYEVWEGSMRKVHIKVPRVVPLRQWCHFAITMTTNHPTASTLRIYRNGKVVHTEENAYLPQNSYTTKNYIGKSNWMDSTAADQNQDELFKGSLFDVRGYRTAMTEKKVKDTVEWGRDLLGVRETT